MTRREINYEAKKSTHPLTAFIYRPLRWESRKIRKIQKLLLLLVVIDRLKEGSSLKREEVECGK